MTHESLTISVSMLGRSFFMSYCLVNITSGSVNKKYLRGSVAVKVDDLSQGINDKTFNRLSWLFACKVKVSDYPVQIFVSSAGFKVFYFRDAFAYGIFQYVSV